MSGSSPSLPNDAARLTTYKDPQPLPFELFSWRWIPRRTLAPRSLTAPSPHVRPSVRPSLRGPTVLSPSNPSERWRFTSAVLRRRRPHYFPGRLGSHGHGDTSSCLSSCPLWLYKICDTSARRAARAPRARLPWNSPCAPPTASSLPWLCGWIQKLRNHSGSQKQNSFMFSTD